MQRSNKKRMENCSSAFLSVKRVSFSFLNYSKRKKKKVKKKKKLFTSESFNRKKNLLMDNIFIFTLPINMKVVKHAIILRLLRSVIILRLTTFPEVGEGDVEFNPCCRWYIFGVSMDGGAPRLPGATATLVMVVPYDGRSPRLLRTTCPRPSAISVIGHPRTVTSETPTHLPWIRFVTKR